MQTESTSTDPVTNKEVYSIDLCTLKNLNKTIKSDVLQCFQEKAFGDDTTPGIEKISKEIE